MNTKEEQMQYLGQTAFEKDIAVIIKTAPAIHVKGTLDGIIDLSLLKKNGFEKVKKVVFSPGKIISIVNIPDTCEIIHCANNALTSIELTSKLKELNMEQNNLSEIQISLCPNLQKLNISHNKIEELENLPMTLAELNCSYNELHRLDLFGLDRLTTLTINNNKLISVLNIPSSLKYIQYYDNPLKEIEQLETMKDLKVFKKTEFVIPLPVIVPPLVKLEDDDKSEESDRTDISTDMDYKEALIKYFTMKMEYDTFSRIKRRQIRNQTKNKEKMQLLLSDFKSKCIVCNRNVGTIFKKKNNHYIAICGDVGKDPCRLNIKIFNGDYYNFFDDMHLFKEHSQYMVGEIIKKKMDVVFNYINEKDALVLFDANLEKYTSTNERYNLLIDKYKMLYENPAKKEIIHLKTEKMYEIMGKLKEREGEYKKNPHNKELLTEMVEIYNTELIPTIVELRNVKYEDVGVICGEKDYSPCKLVKNELKYDNFIFCTEEPKIIRFVV